MDGQKLTALRKHREWTLRQLSIRTGLTERTLGDLERGVQTNPHLDTLQTIADAYGMSLVALLSVIAQDSVPPEPVEVAS